MNRVIEEGLKFSLDKECSAQDGEFKRHGLPFNELSAIVKQLDLQIKFLRGLIYRLVQDAADRKNSSIRILRSPDEIAGYIFENNADFVMLNSPEYMPVVIRRKDFGWVWDKDEFADWLTVHWESEMLVIMVA